MYGDCLQRDFPSMKMINRWYICTEYYCRNDNVFHILSSFASLCHRRTHSRVVINKVCLMFNWIPLCHPRALLWMREMNKFTQRTFLFWYSYKMQAICNTYSMQPKHAWDLKTTNQILLFFFYNHFSPPPHCNLKHQPGRCYQVFCWFKCFKSTISPIKRNPLVLWSF